MKRHVLLIAATFIFSLGVVMIFSTTSADMLDHGKIDGTHSALVKQLSYALAGLMLGGVVWKAGYKRVLELSPYLLAIFTVLLVLTLIPGIGREVNGSKRWLGIGGFSFQPSEFVKYLVPAFLIYRYTQFKGEVFTLRDFLKLAGLVAVPIFLIMIEPNNGTSAVIVATSLMLCLLMGVPAKFWALPLACFAVMGALFAYNLPYVKGRLNSYLNPEVDLKGKGHQPYQAKIAAGSGGVLGKGPGNSLQKLSYLPEAQNDYIAAIYAEEFGFVGMLTLIVLYMTLGTSGFAIASSANFAPGCYLAATVAFLFSLQAFLNLGVVSGLLPSTGLNLPLFSQGGTSLMANIMGLSLLLNVEAHG